MSPKKPNRPKEHGARFIYDNLSRKIPTTKQYPPTDEVTPKQKDYAEPSPVVMIVSIGFKVYLVLELNLSGRRCQLDSKGSTERRYPLVHE